MDLGTRDFETSGHGTTTHSPAVSRQSIKILRRVILDVRGLVVARLPHIGTIAIRDGIDNPLGQVLGGRIEIQHLVEVRVVYLAVDQTFDFSEVAHHAVVVQLLGAAIHIDFPVMAMEVLAFALVVKVELMAGGYF